MEDMKKISKNKSKPKRVTKKQLEEMGQNSRECVAKYRAKLSEEQKAAIREKNREYRKKLRESEFKRGRKSCDQREKSRISKKVEKISKTKSKPKNTDEKQLEEMRQKNQERMAKWRAKLSEEQKAAIREKNREYIKKLKDMGAIKPINELSRKEQLKRRKQWSKDSSNYRKRKSKIKIEEVYSVQEDFRNEGSLQKEVGDKSAKQSVDAMQKTIEKLKMELDKKSRKIETLRKQVYRAKKAQREVLTPQTYVNKFIRKKKASLKTKTNIEPKLEPE